MSKKDKVINNPDEHADSKKIQRWSVWTQGPKDAKETQRKFALATPGQERDYKKLVGTRKFQRFEQVESVTPKKEETPANSVGGGGVDMAPNAGPPSKTTKVFMRRRRKARRVDGRTKAYKEAMKRIKERHLKKAQKEVEQRYSNFAAQAYTHTEGLEMSNKYLNTKVGSLEQAVLQSVATETTSPDDGEMLTLPKNRYLESKEGSLEYAAIKSIAEKHKPGHKLPRQLTDPKKEKMVGTKSGTKVVDRNDPKYKKHPEHEEVELGEKGWFPGMDKDKKNGDEEKETKDKKDVKKVKHEKGDKSDEMPDKKAGESDDEYKDRTKGRKKFSSFTKGKKQDDLDKDDEAQATRSKKKPTAESVEITEKDSRRTVDAIRAYYRSKDASRDATSDTDKGKKAKGDKEKAYAKKERGEIKKDDPDWKHKKGHTGMHGEAKDREIGTDEYADYTRNLTPGQTKEIPAVATDNKQAKKNDLIQKAANHIKKHHATKIDDSFRKEDVEVDEAQKSSVKVGGMTRRAVVDPKSGKRVITPGMDLKLKRQLLRGKNRATANKVAKKDPKRPYEPRNKIGQAEAADARQASIDKGKAEKPVSTKSPRDRAELDKAIAAYKAKGGKTTVLKSKKRKSHQDPTVRTGGEKSSFKRSGMTPARRHTGGENPFDRAKNSQIPSKSK